MNLPDFLHNDDGEIHPTGSRIGLYSVIDRHQRGSDVEALHEEFPTLSRGLLRDVLAFYERNRNEVDAYVEKYRADLIALEKAEVPSKAVLRIRRLMAEREAVAHDDRDL